MTVSIIGTSHSKVGRLDGETVYSLLIEAGREALKDANVTGKDIDAIYVSNYGGASFNKQSHLGPYALEIDPELRFTPATRVENACASGSNAVKEAINVIEAGKADTVLVIGVEKMTSLNTKGVTETLALASYYPEEGAKGYTFPGLYAEYAKGYMKKYGYSLEELYDTLAYITVKAHKNAMSNPLAQMHVEFEHDFAKQVSDNNPLIADPLKLTDCSLISDGAAAMVLTRTELAKSKNDKVVEIASISHVTDYLSIVEGKRANYELTGAKLAVEQVLKEANMTINDINVGEVHDCFTITELLIYEALGLAQPGKGKDVLLDRTVYIDGKLPINPSGGLKAKGHPIGATGVSMFVLVAKQLLGEAIGLQVDNAKNGLVLNIGGSGGTNIASVLTRIK